MEPTSNFSLALKSVLNQRKAAGLSVNGDLLVSRMCDHPFASIHGETVNLMDRAHRQVRRYYIRQTWSIRSLFGSIDWSTITDWLYEHWDDILRILLAILPLLI